jgi:hypothetical protein
MGRRGVIYHVRGKRPAKDFERLGKRCAVLASNRSWTSFVPLGRMPSGEAMSRALGAPVLAIWSDDDHGTNLDFFTPDGWNAELSISLHHEPLGAPDRDLLRQLVKTGFVPRDRVATLTAGLARKNRAAWIESDGVETALGVPWKRPLWSPLSESILREKGMSVTIVLPSRRPALRAKPKPQARQPRAAIDPRVLALHLHYWSDLFQMNCWKLYKLYKKHLPAERRREVDELCDHVALGEEAKLRRGVETILEAVWNATDWDAAIRDPELVRWEPLSAAQLADWQQRLAS